ncbi:MAG TPA: DUF742 domain-containing protein [Streptosporangiaceae bacterium]|nr:DUF742 domain-containing protein [Streptosporangiaceae bacterium]
MTAGERSKAGRAPGPVVRPYALVRGRTRPTGETLDVITMVRAAVGADGGEHPDLEPEHLAVLAQCAVPTSVAELASLLDLPLGVIRVLLADLRDRHLVTTRQPSPARTSNIRLLREVADGLRRL